MGFRRLMHRRFTLRKLNSKWDIRRRRSLLKAPWGTKGKKRTELIGTRNIIHFDHGTPSSTTFGLYRTFYCHGVLGRGVRDVFLGGSGWKSFITLFQGLAVKDTLTAGRKPVENRISDCYWLGTTIYITTQHPPPSPFSIVNKAALVASSRTSSTPSPVKEEHSRYFRAPISCAASFPSFDVVNCKDFFLISSCASGSSRKSFFSPTTSIGGPGHRSWTSSIHLFKYQPPIFTKLATLLPCVWHYQENPVYRPGSRSV